MPAGGCGGHTERLWASGSPLQTALCAGENDTQPPGLEGKTRRGASCHRAHPEVNA